MASLIKKVTSFVSKNMILLIALLVGIIGIGYYSGSKSVTMDSMTNNRAHLGESGNAHTMDSSNVNPAGPLGTNADFAQVENIKTSTPGSIADTLVPILEH